MTRVPGQGELYQDAKGWECGPVMGHISSVVQLLAPACVFAIDFFCMCLSVCKYRLSLLSYPELQLCPPVVRAVCTGVAYCDTSIGCVSYLGELCCPERGCGHSLHSCGHCCLQHIPRSDTQFPNQQSNSGLQCITCYSLSP